MASKVIVHHDDGHKTPLIEMQPGETGHVEGLVCGPSLARSLAVLGVEENARITMVRRLPPMEYQAIVDGRRVRLPEGAAAKLWGEMDDRLTQFVSSAKGKPFKILQLLGGDRARNHLEMMGLCPGVTILLERLTPAATVGRTGGDQTVIVAESGLRLYLRPDQAMRISVRHA